MNLLLFVSALAIAYLVPGPDMMLILQTGALRGRLPAMATALGLGIARAAHVALAGAGLAALLRTAPFLFDAIRLVGALYLTWIGLGLWRARANDDTSTHGAAPSSGIARAAMRGFLTNIANPKALLFCSILLPQFVNPSNGAVATQFAMLGTILVGIGAAFDLAYAGLGASLGGWISDRPGLKKLQARLFGTALIGFGLRLALAERPG